MIISYPLIHLKFFVVVIKGMLQSSRLEDHMKSIGIDQSLRNRPSVEHTFLNNI